MLKWFKQIVLCLLCSGFLFTTSICQAADSKVSALTELTTVADADVLYIIDDFAGTPTSKRITRANFLNLNISTPQLTFSDLNHAPSSVGEFLYDNIVTGLDDGAITWYDDDEIRTIVDLDGTEILGSEDNLDFVQYIYNSGNGYFHVASAVKQTNSPLNGEVGLWVGADGEYMEGKTEAEFKTLFNMEAGTDYENVLTNSAGLASALSDETGTGVAVFGTSPTFTTVINTPAIKLSDLSHSPGQVGVFLYSNTVTGLADGGLLWYDDDEIRTIVDLDGSEALEAGDDGHAVIYNYNAGNGYFDLQSAGAGSTAYDDIGDPDANSTIAFAGFTNTWTSTLDTGTMFKIDNTDADLSADTILLDLEYTDDGDANGIFLRCLDNNGDVVYKIGADGAVETGTAGTGSITLGSAGVIMTDDGDGALIITGNGDGSDEDLNINLDDTANTAVISSSTGVTLIDAGSIAFATTGFINGMTDTDEITGNTTLSNLQVHNAGMYVTAACTVTLPAVSACGVGSIVLVYVRDASETVIIDANAADRIILYGTALDDGDSIDSPGAAGDFIVLWATDANGWVSLGASGTWTDGGAS
jgi:hypothetical protein